LDGVSYGGGERGVRRGAKEESTGPKKGGLESDEERDKTLCGREWGNTCSEHARARGKKKQH